ncbi:MAG TPA: 2OG-Fe(II) oxygenase family protein [Steroidobacteraceae bacterium]|nr:2OG-Fe(II) oxygenase family protein [Steroidobacteraceae bacterium]
MSAEQQLCAARPAPAIRLNPALDAQLIARVFRSAGRVHVPDFFDAPTAALIHRSLAEETRWQLVLHDGGGHRELPVPALSSLPEEERRDWLARVHRAAERGFSYCYSTFRLFENYLNGRHLDSQLMRVLEFLNAPAFLGFARRLTGDARIGFADGQATMYRAGDFLTRHDDAVDGRHRVAAYVLGFTPEWRTDWGGLLAFPDRHGHLAEAYLPTFNSLNLFRVPMLHAVTQVASFAAAPRYSITGWLRALPDSG